MGKYEFSKLTESDIDRIYEYGILNYGRAQAQDYLLGLHDQFQILADSKLFGRSAEQLAPNLRKLEYESDVIYYLPQDDGVFIVRVIGKWMNPQNHL